MKVGSDFGDKFRCSLRVPFVCGQNRSRLNGVLLIAVVTASWDDVLLRSNRFNIKYNVLWSATQSHGPNFVFI